MPRCEGRALGPGQVQPCPDSRNDNSVRGRQGDLLLCDACTEFRFPSTAQPPPATNRQPLFIPGMNTGSESSKLVQCELLYFLTGVYGQHPDATIKMTILEFYRDEEILMAKQLLLQATENIDHLHIQPFVKKRSGANKCKSTVEDIFNIVKVVDEQSSHDKLPKFCAVDKHRVPTLPEEQTDMAAIRLEVSQLRQHVEDLTKQFAAHCKSLNVVKETSANCSRATAVRSSDSSHLVHVNHEQVEVEPTINTDSLTNRSSVKDDTDAVAAATFADHVKSLREGDFREIVNKKNEKRSARKRVIIGDNHDYTGFKGIAKKSVFCVNRLETDTTCEMIEDFLKSNNVNVFSCYRVLPKTTGAGAGVDINGSSGNDADVRFVSMRVCIAQYDNAKLMSSDMWPKGVTVRPWVFKTRQSA